MSSGPDNRTARRADEEPTAPVSLHGAVKHVAGVVILYVIPFAGGLYLAFRSLRDRALALPALYLLFGLALAFTSGKIGASRSYFFDSASALSLMTVFLLARIAGRDYSEGKKIVRKDGFSAIWSIVKSRFVDQGQP